MLTESDYKKEQEQLLNSLMIQAKKKGFIHIKTIMKRFEKYNISDDEKDNLIFVFENEGISIIYSEDKPPGEKESSLEFNTNSFSIPQELKRDSGEDFGDSVKTYLRQIHDFPALTHKETIALVKQAHEGDKAARDNLICCNLKLAFLIAIKYVGTSVPLLDLIQQANIGLIRAIDYFNPSWGTKFSTYVVFWIKNSILKYISDHSRTIRIPEDISFELFRIKAIEEDYYRKNQRYPTDDEIATAMGISIGRVKNLKLSEYTIISTDETVYDDNNQTILDVHEVEDEEQDPYLDMRSSDLHQALTRYLSELPERERFIIESRFGLIDGKPKTLEQVGAELGITKERVRQLEARAMNKIRNMNGITSLHDYIT